MSMGMLAFHVADATAADAAALKALAGRPVALPPEGAPDTEHRLLVVRDADSRMAGMVRLQARIGQAAAMPGDNVVPLKPAFAQPRYWYHVGCAVHAAAELKIYHRQLTLLLCNDLMGATAMSDLVGEPEAVHAGMRAAQRVVARDQAHWGNYVIAELPGVRDEAGRSPFWEGLGRHFYDGDPAAAQREHGDGWRDLAAALLPRQVIYTSFLPAAAQAAISQAHEDMQPLQAALVRDGWSYRQHVRVDDGGPVMVWRAPAGVS
jgi:arginine/ornithine succinyltransferase subunit-like protein